MILFDKKPLSVDEMYSIKNDKPLIRKTYYLEVLIFVHILETSHPWIIPILPAVLVILGDK